MSALDAAGLLVYRRRASPLHAARATVVAAYGCAIALPALLTEHPLLLASLLATVLLAGAGAGVGGAMLRLTRAWVLPVLLLTVLVNVLVSRQGLTVFARLGDWGVLGQVDLTSEAVVYGCVFALRLTVVALACLLVVAAADPDQLLSGMRRVSPRSALTVALSTRLVGVLAADARRLAEAQRARAGVEPSRPAGRRARRTIRLPRAEPSARRSTAARLAILRATVAGALDRSLDVAAVLEMRGYGAGPRPRSRVPRSRHDLAFMAAAAAVLAGVSGAIATGAARFGAYPLVHMRFSAVTVAVAVALPAVALLPFADRRGIEL
ncbi:MAG TPA: energy-coupling factor transporter transmembrane component T [Solirubrobacteraceae bacterium]